MQGQGDLREGKKSVSLTGGPGRRAARVVEEKFIRVRQTGVTRVSGRREKGLTLQEESRRVLLLVKR